MIARTDEVEKALYLRQWGVPFDALAYVFGRDAMFCIAPGWPLAARRLSAPLSKSHRRCRAIWWPMRS